MNSQFLLEKLESSEDYKKFISENKDAYLCSGFFVIDLSEHPENKYHFDFYVPSTKKTFSFEIENGTKKIELERNDSLAMNHVTMKIPFDFDKIKEKILTEMELKKINNKIQKMIFSLQNKDGDDFLLGTIFLSGLGLIRANLNLNKNTFTEFEKKSLFDMIKIVKGKKD
jgi:hypothetical protein